MPTSILQARQHYTALHEQHLTMRYYDADKLLFNEWRGVVPSEVLKLYTLTVCHFVVDYEVAYVLADYSRMTAPSLVDQLWVINHSENLLRHSVLLRVATVLSPELFQPLEEPATNPPAIGLKLPCDMRDFPLKEEALHWLLPM
ncbi:hypothetical protein [Pontibacter flavimaris]|uniref:Uncharacterized protein n=1 Tax=Pontibacter flavimaris TaxID=1797110 RepID=A0A1Q5PBM8_9BACT|nr:hypothetical protein [Pontibacter flavimaris]OKL39597.1 hypothetical protein A3841_01230 [Pontibacter flavimaris]